MVVDENRGNGMVSSTDMTRLDAKRIVQRFGGRSELWRRLEKHGHHVSVKTIEKWQERNSIPTARLLVLMDLARKEGKPLNVEDYVIKKNL